MQQKTAKIVMIAMFKNEAAVIQRMLESCYKYIDFYVIQDNGSTDGTDQIVKDFFAERNIPGVLYTVEEGWQGFGWNRDHLIQHCQSIDHGCDWILKMDCDEWLEVADDFNWSPINDTSHQAFHIAAKSGSCIYYRSWMWNAKLQWRFNHDPCHETIYCADPAIGAEFVSYNLPPTFCQHGGNEGQSWSVPTKFISDSLTLEEKLIREGTMLDNLYHFWYVGKSYFDAYVSTAFPLGHAQQKEFARRAIFYFQEHINYTHDFRATKKPKCIDETAYMGLVFSGECYEFLGNDESAIISYSLANDFAPRRNDHWFNLARLYYRIGDFANMLACTTVMMQPARTNPFPEYSAFIDTSLYHDCPQGRVQELHNTALANADPYMIDKEHLMSVTPDITEYIHTTAPPIEQVVAPPIEQVVAPPIDHDDQLQSARPLFAINPPTKKLFVVDNFYTDPDAVRNFALTQVEFQEDLRYYKGLRSTKNFLTAELKQAFEKIIGETITVWEEYGSNGCFQITTSANPQVYHFDEQKWAAMIYLTPDAPIESGTRTHRSRINGASHKNHPGADAAFAGDFYDSTRHDTVDSIGNIYNRLVIMDAQTFHSAGAYFGNTPETGRLTHLFFFD